MTTPEHVAVNRAHWDASAHEWVESGERAWRAHEITWGMWGVPERELQLLPADLPGMDVIELGCGTGYFGAWLAKRGARVVGVDVSHQQLVTAARLGDEHGVDLALVECSAESVPVGGGGFDLAISEYGAALWCDPAVWLREAHRLLRPGGELIFLASTPLAALCSPEDGSLPLDETLRRSYFDLYVLDWRDALDDPGGIEFVPPISTWVKLFLDIGFTIEAFHELQAPEPGEEIRFFTSADWAHRWPSEQIWKVRKEQ